MSTRSSQARLELVLEPDDAQRLVNLSGPFDSHLRQIELRLGIEIRNRANRFQLLGGKTDIARGEAVLQELFNLTLEDTVTSENVHMALVTQIGDGEVAPEAEDQAGPRDEVVIRGKRGVVRGRSVQQKLYLKNIATHDLNFGIGPAGTGKTYLAVASAVNALERDRVRRIVLVRPAVEAGEKLGFLPGDMAEKINPYLRPLYDALYEMMGFERVARLVEKSVIEIAPLAFMRGRTLNESFVILDEAQNTSVEQMKMFLTRIGFGSAAVVTGDLTQIDLPKHQMSGLRQAQTVLAGVPGISFTQFKKEDVVRHPLVQAIVQAYEQHELREPEPRAMSGTIAVQRSGVSARGLPSAISLRGFAQAALPRKAGEVTIRIVAAREGRNLNRQYRDRDYATNVLSFQGEAEVLGDLVICAPVVAREAREQAKPLRAHWAHLVVHGCLHLQGYDHENDHDAQRMEAREIRILKGLGFDNPYHER